MSIVSPNLAKPTFMASKVAFKADGDKELTQAERRLVESGWGSDTSKASDDSSGNKMSTTKKILIGTGLALLALAVTLRIAKPETVKAFTEGKKWIPNFLKTGLDKTSEFLNKYTFGAGSEGAWGKLFGRTKATPTTEPTPAPAAPAKPTAPVAEATPVGTPPAATTPTPTPAPVAPAKPTAPVAEATPVGTPPAAVEPTPPAATTPTPPAAVELTPPAATTPTPPAPSEGFIGTLKSWRQKIFGGNTQSAATTTVAETVAPAATTAAETTAPVVTQAVTAAAKTVAPAATTAVETTAAKTLEEEIFAGTI